MKSYGKLLAVGLVCVAGVAAAKEGVTNPVVKERMDVMQVIRANTGALGDMASGKAAFDGAKAAEAAAAIAGAAATIPTVFEPQETDPVSEAKPAIWENFSDFTTKADALTTAAQSLDTGSLDALKAGMGAVGGACKACHTDYRIQTN
ncbi:c-type cytochrome [Pseudothioclava nitratireducens]|jgi:cytochrome c556|uniref:c-type cytochrome n=1 Tax=Pseudothioclava nitratireducens TaxID=1928646 RepID=UPI0023DA91B2|nr:cytochrome c [Defluviimonas nitratireducens]MDF1619115.1 cytochrome c [Defluviimonas nitratireducens]